jgi:hypothetical protein
LGDDCFGHANVPLAVADIKLDEKFTASHSACGVNSALLGQWAPQIAWQGLRTLPLSILPAQRDADPLGFLDERLPKKEICERDLISNPSSWI